MLCNKCNTQITVSKDAEKSPWYHSCKCAMPPDFTTLEIVNQMIKVDSANIAKSRRAVDNMYKSTSRRNRTKKMRKAMAMEQKAFPIVEQNLRVLAMAKKEIEARIYNEPILIEGNCK